MRARFPFSSSRLKSYVSAAVLLGTLAASSSTFAAVTFTAQPTGASRVELVDNRYYVYAGFAGSCNAQDTSSTCDSCLGDDVVVPGTTSGLVPCNRTNAYTDLLLLLTVDLGSTTVAQGDIRLRFAGSSTNTITPDSVAMSGSVATVGVKWGRLCNGIKNDSNNCKTDLNSLVGVGYQGTSGDSSGAYIDFQVITHYIDTTAGTIPSQFYKDCNENDGFCGYSIAPGDEKIYIDDLQWSGGFPSSSASGADYSNLLFFFRKVEDSAGGTPTATIEEMTNQDNYYSLVAAKDITPPVEDDRVTGLENDKEYCFILANQDKTGVISRFAPNIGADAVTAAEVCGTPSKVYGLLDNKKCFIATAAYGSSMSPEVQTFRDFRNQFLLSSEWGKSAVRFYYEHSPTFAKIIAHNEVLRAGARGVLWPVLGLVKLSLAWGVVPVLGLMMTTLGGAVFFWRRRTLRGEV